MVFLRVVVTVVGMVEGSCSVCGGHGAEVMWGYGEGLSCCEVCDLGIVLWGCLLGCMGDCVLVRDCIWGVLCLWVNGFVGMVCDIVCVCVWGCDLRFGVCGVGHIVCGVGFT